MMLNASFVLATCFAAGLVTAGVVSGAGPLAVLSTDATPETTETTTTETTTETSTDPGSELPPEAQVACAQTGSETVATDKSNYEPEELVLVTGSGYSPSCVAIVKITRPDGSVVVGDGSFEPGSDSGTTGVDGSLVYEYRLNGITGEYLLEVLGADDAVLASMTFFDARVLTNAQLYNGTSYVNTITVTPSASVIARVTGNTDGNGNGDDWQCTNWSLDGSGASPWDDPFVQSGEDNSISVTEDVTGQTHDVTIAAPATAGTYYARFLMLLYEKYK
jgi:hypothetical protein